MTAKSIPCPGLREAIIPARWEKISDAARGLGYGRSRLTNWLHSGSAPEEHLHLIAAKLGVPLETLTLAGAPRAPADELRAIAEELAVLSTRLQHVISRLLGA